MNCISACKYYCLVSSIPDEKVNVGFYRLGLHLEEGEFPLKSLTAKSKRDLIKLRIMKHISNECLGKLSKIGSENLRLPDDCDCKILESFLDSSTRPPQSPDCMLCTVYDQNPIQVDHQENLGHIATNKEYFTPHMPTTEPISEYPTLSYQLDHLSNGTSSEWSLSELAESEGGSEKSKESLDVVSDPSYSSWSMAPDWKVGVTASGANLFDIPKGRSKTASLNHYDVSEISSPCYREIPSDDNLFTHETKRISRVFEELKEKRFCNDQDKRISLATFEPLMFKLSSSTDSEPTTAEDSAYLTFTKSDGLMKLPSLSPADWCKNQNHQLEKTIHFAKLEYRYHGNYPIPKYSPFETIKIQEFGGSGALHQTGSVASIGPDKKLTSEELRKIKVSLLPYLILNNRFQ